jgi:hypothetical protein
LQHNSDALTAPREGDTICLSIVTAGATRFDTAPPINSEIPFRQAGTAQFAESENRMRLGKTQYDILVETSSEA